MELCMIQKREQPAVSRLSLPVNETKMKNLPGQIRIGMLEPDPQMSDLLHRHVLSNLAFDANYDFPLFRFYRKIPISDLSKCAPWLHLVLVSMECEGLKALLREIYEQNPDCLIVLYGTANGKMEQFYPMRPCMFLPLPKMHTEDEWQSVCRYFREILHSLLTGGKHGNPIYRFATRNAVHLVAQNDILYLQNMQRSTLISLREQRTLEINRPLSEFESQMGAAFVRIHKSYLVNSAYIRFLDKQRHRIILENGEELAVSDGYYKQVCRKLERTEEPLYPLLHEI